MRSSTHDPITRRGLLRSAVAGAMSGVCARASRAAEATGPQPAVGHPRLYLSAAGLPRLRGARRDGWHRIIWQNIEQSAQWCLALTARKSWIAPVSPDPRYENLYDRFYAIMGDLAITEHLALAYAIGGDPRFGRAARAWTLASCRAWRREAEGSPDGSKAYAVSRLLKGVAVGYDCVFDLLSPAERDEVRGTLTAIARKYFAGYFSTESIKGRGFHTHHAIVEWASFGVAALAVLGENPEAGEWLAATLKKFEEHLLPFGLAADGAQIEGPTFWASTMHYRLFFMDALRRVTGTDLFGKHRNSMNADLALASIAAERHPGWDCGHASVVLEPPYGQLDYYAPLLVFLAREYRRPIYQYLALWDHTLGQLQQTRYVTPHGERLLFALGPYSYLWYDPTVPPTPDEPRLSYSFPSMGEAYARNSWAPGELVVGVRGRSDLVVHAGGRPVLVALGGPARSSGSHITPQISETGRSVVIRTQGPNTPGVNVELDRGARKVTIRRTGEGNWQWWSQGQPVHEGNRVLWGDRVTLQVTRGSLVEWAPAGFSENLAVGFGLLPMADPAPQKFPLATARPAASGETVVEIRLHG